MKQRNHTHKDARHRAILIALTVMSLTPWQMKTFEETGKLPRAHREYKIEKVLPPVPWKPDLNHDARRKLNRIEKQRVVDTPVKQPKKVLPDVFRGIKEDKNWVRNDKRFIKRQMKLKHYISTGEWKEFDVPTNEVT